MRHVVGWRTSKIKKTAGETLWNSTVKTMTLGNYIHIGRIGTKGVGGIKATEVCDC